MNVQEFFLQYIKNQHLLTEGEKTLLAVSGGVDSMVLADLFKKSGLDFAIVHIDHQLRGEESVMDVMFVKNYCADNSITFFGEKIEKGLLSGSGLQDKARQLRYAIFNKIADEHQFHKIATAHHKDDELETFLINTMRGTGLSGLTGISKQKDKVIRPLLFAARLDILEYAEANNILFREDSSNLKSMYTRNFIRNRILPEFDTIDYRKREGFYTTIGNLHDSQELFQEMVKHFNEMCISREDEIYQLDIKPLQNIKNAVLLLYFMLEKFGFNKTQIEDLFSHQLPGNLVKNERFILSVERNGWMIRPVASLKMPEVSIEIPGLPFTVTLNQNMISFFAEKELQDAGAVGIDISKVNFPLFLRKWKNSDVFRPLSMHGNKKEIKKILSEQKIPSFQKNEVLVLVDHSGEIVAIIGLGSSYTFSSSISTEGFLIIETDR
jgi:tRNA(Ile)-lysidine synthase